MSVFLSVLRYSSDLCNKHIDELIKRCVHVFAVIPDSIAAAGFHKHAVNKKLTCAAQYLPKRVMANCFFDTALVLSGFDD